MITLTLPLAPQPKERPRLGKAGRIYTPKATAEYEHAVRLCAAHLPSLEGALRLDAVFIFDRPKSLKSRGRSPRTSRPDLDNLLKALCDGLQGALFADDAQVVEMHAAKVYAAEDEAAHIEVQITQITQVTQVPQVTQVTQVGDTPAEETTARAETETHARTRAQERQANREAHRAEQARRDAAESPRSRARADNRAQHLARLLDRPTLTEEDKAARRRAKLLEAETRREQKKIAALEARRQKSEEEKAAWLESWRRRTSGSF